jgi:hypothetical protein
VLPNTQSAINEVDNPTKRIYGSICLILPSTSKNVAWSDKLTSRRIVQSDSWVCSKSLRLVRDSRFYSLVLLSRVRTKNQTKLQTPHVVLLPYAINLCLLPFLISLDTGTCRSHIQEGRILASWGSQSIPTPSNKIYSSPLQSVKHLNAIATTCPQIG